MTIKEAHKQAKTWTKSTLDLIEYCCRALKPTVELVQAMIIVSFLVFHLDAASAKYRSLNATAISPVRDMSFHRIDVPASRKFTFQPLLSEVDAEIARRVWWYLAATDWYDHLPISCSHLITTTGY